MREIKMLVARRFPYRTNRGKRLGEQTLFTITGLACSIRATRLLLREHDLLFRFRAWGARGGGTSLDPLPCSSKNWLLLLFRFSQTFN